MEDNRGIDAESRCREGSRGTGDTPGKLESRSRKGRQRVGAERTFWKQRLRACGHGAGQKVGETRPRGQKARGDEGHKDLRLTLDGGSEWVSALVPTQYLPPHH